jgi:hypothetical protein
VEIHCAAGRARGLPRRTKPRAPGNAGADKPPCLPESFRRSRFPARSTRAGQPTLFQNRRRRRSLRCPLQHFERATSERVRDGAQTVRELRRYVDTLWAKLDDSTSNLSRCLMSHANDKAKSDARELVKESESRLKRFLIRLGRALADKSKRRALPDWEHKVDRPMQLIAEGWCERISVDGKMWPPLCCLSTPAIKKLLSLSKVIGTTREARTIEQAIRRLGLKRIPRGRIQDVEEKFGVFRFG